MTTYRYDFKGVTLLKGAVHLENCEDPEAFSVVEVQLHTLSDLIQAGAPDFDRDGFTSLPARRQAELLLRARRSASNNMLMPLITLERHQPICFFENFALPDKQLPEPAGPLDLLYPHRETLYASCLLGNDLILLFHALGAARITIQVAKGQEQLINALCGGERTDVFFKAAANDQHTVTPSEDDYPSL